MKKFIRYFTPIVGLLLFFEILSCQSIKEVAFDFDIYEYKINDYTVNVCLIKIVNESDDNLVLWLDKNSIKGMTNKQKIQRYFLKSKGDFSFYNLLTERLIKEGSPMVFGTFLVQLNKEDDFLIRIVSENLDGKRLKEKCQEFIDEHLVFVPKKELLSILQLDNSFFHWFDYPSIEIPFKHLP